MDDSSVLRDSVYPAATVTDSTALVLGRREVSRKAPSVQFRKNSRTCTVRVRSTHASRRSSARKTLANFQPRRTASSTTRLKTGSRWKIYVAPIRIPRGDKGVLSTLFFPLCFPRTELCSSVAAARTIKIRIRTLSERFPFTKIYNLFSC